MTTVLATWREYDCSARIDLLEGKAPKLCAAIVAMLPLKSIGWHGVLSGENVGWSVPFVHTSFENPQPRTYGNAYLYANGQLGIIPYGVFTEPGDVNTWGRVRDEDMPGVARVGEIMAARFRIRQESPVFVDLRIDET